MNATTPIRLKDALELLESGTPVAVRYVKANRRKKTGGDFGELPAARLGSGKRKAEATFRAPLPGEETDEQRADCAADGMVPVPNGVVPAPKDPNHYQNATRNLVDTRTGALVKVHIYLLVSVAGRKVII
ncbi:hypothetical protein [Hymenobacter crusticola]|uniref:Uncharacterized protein n=1 Tax=Hymenobacter crusticola TaxID=1770526 RepID=A0A243W7U0_9BACT|nr:hypothetical protein [Hymenobacter crusticola]OUJ68664.1 hypothetical protein BXP70_27640 [Hymenobacter crusticola]